ncbi:microtubule-associated protein 2 isoform X6 [Apis mellifera]|uniref:Microtubule-associated protein n=1 Tax=Apis mellifera TaxID=7460 RepID=A0A7M7MSC2_APIME|nr:microtubule-associated protein 2 isoform X6 [Apis mellifera]|eukprot:XP_026300292.1 microtubule-associated protein 2 isoform X6 [Apis mellifera]
MNEVKMDSQETKSNAAESPSNRESNVVKPNPPLPTVYRARPQGPPGLPRHPVNNGPIGQPRPGHGQPQIRFDNRQSPGQFAQLRPQYGPPRQPVLPYQPQKPQPPGQHPPNIVPRFPQSQLQRPGPPRPPPPPSPSGNYRAQKFQAVPQRSQQPRPEHPQQRNQDSQILTRSRCEIVQRQSRERNECSLLSAAFQQNLEQGREEWKRGQQVARVVVDKMADVDNSSKVEQFETVVVSREKGELRGNEKDDDDDVVMDDGRRPSPRANGDVPGRGDFIESSLKNEVKRPETATMNGEMGEKPDVVGEKRNKDSNVAEGDNRLSGKLDEEARKIRPLDKKDVDDDQMDEPERKLLKDQNEKENSNKENENAKQAAQVDANSAPNIGKDRVKKGNSMSEEKLTMSDASSLDVKDRVEKENSMSEEKLTMSDASSLDVKDRVENLKKEGGTRVTVQADMHSVSLTKDQIEKQNSIKKDDASSVPSVEEDSNKEIKDAKQADANSIPTVVEGKVGEKSAEEKKLEQSLNASPEKPAKPAEDDSQQTQALSSKPSSDECPMKEESKTSADKLSNNLEASRDEGETKKQSKEDELTKVQSGEEAKTPKKEETKEDRKEKMDSKPEIKSEMKSEDVKEQDKDEEGSKVSKDTSMETNRSKKEEKPETKEVPKPSISLDPDHSPREKESSDSSAGLESVLKNSHPVEEEESLEQESVTAKSRPASGKEEASETKLSALSEDLEKAAESAELSPPMSPEEEGAKGFDNGQQRSLSIKSSPSQSLQSPASPKSPKSPKSPTDDKRKVAEGKVKSEEEKDGDKTAAETLKSCASKSVAVKRAPTSGKQDKKSRKKSSTTPEVENGSVTNESVQSNAEPTTNGVGDSPTKKSPSKTKEADKRSTAGSPVKSPSKSVKSLPRTPDTPSSTTALEKKKLPMNKIQVGSAPSPNLKTVRSKIGSLENASYKPGGGKVKIENRKLDFSKAQPKIAAKNEKYTPSGGDKKIAQIKLQWNAKPKVGSLENATYKPGGGDKKIETVKLDFKDKAKPKVGSKENAKHIPGGGSIKSSATPPKTPQDTNNDIQTQKIDIKAESKVGSLDNVKHKPGGGDKKIFNDKEYLRQTGTNPESLCGSGSQEHIVEEINSSLEQVKDDLPQPPPSTPTKIQNLPSPSSMVTPKAVRSSLAKSPEIGSKKNSSSLEIIEKEDGNKKNLSSEDRNIMKNRTAKSPIISHSLNNSQAKSPENRTMKSPTSSHILNNSELKSPEDKTMKSPISPRSVNNLRVKSPDKSSSHISGKISPKELRLPKLAPSPTPQEITISEVNAKINLPKLTERITH